MQSIYSLYTVKGDSQPGLKKTRVIIGYCFTKYKKSINSRDLFFVCRNFDVKKIPYCYYLWNQLL